MEFTNEEKERINQLYGTDFKDITPDDALLIGRWEAWKATQESEHRAKIEALKTESDIKAQYAQEEHEKAMNDLQELYDAALKRLEMIEDGI